MAEVLAQADALLGSDAVAHVWTTNPDGTPQVSVVWVIAQGDEIAFGTDTSSQKAKNLRRDNRIVLSIEDTERNARGFQRHLVARGRARIYPGTRSGADGSVGEEVPGSRAPPARVA